MALTDLKLKKSYDSTRDDILEEFYIPVLCNSVKYYRLTGFFSSTSLAIAARGISGLIKNNGIIRIVTSPILSSDDIKAIMDGYKTLEETVSENMLKELNSIDNIEDILLKDHIRALAWLISRGRLEIKVVIPIYNNIPLSKEEIEDRGIFHQKIGILFDKEGNYITFSGSINETARGWLENIEEFKVFRSWIEEEKEYARADLEKFEMYWNGKGDSIISMDVPEAVRKKFIKIAPKDPRELRLVERYVLKSRKKHIILRYYQREAIDSWIDNNYRGIISMATGTGKTIVAIFAMKELLNQRKVRIVVISVPYNHLAYQWENNLIKFGFEKNEIIQTHSQNKNWYKKLAQKIRRLKMGVIDRLIVITTHNTLASDRLWHALNFSYNGSENILLVADEVHGLGAPIRRQGLKEYIKFRLGLSATPERWMDDIGTKILLDYFDGVVYEYGLKKAIDEGYLCKYDYYPEFIELTEDEMEKYIKLTKKIVRKAISKSKKLGVNIETVLKEDDEIQNLVIKRKREIVDNARRKIEKVREILQKLKQEGKLSYCLIYCSSIEQMNQIEHILREMNIIYSRFTAQENLNERKTILDAFSKGIIQVIVAIKCLDEGVDVPPTRRAIIVASSRNPREFVQRRGRILRKSEGKEKAEIYDLIVLPQSSDDPIFHRIEKLIIKKELERIKEFAKCADNYHEIVGKILELLDRY